MRSQPAALAAALRDGLWLAAAPGQAWISRTRPECREPITEPAVRSLLDGALAAAIRLCAPRLPASPPLTPLRWIWRLVGYYHLTHSTTALLQHAAERFATAGERELADWARDRADEEDNHDRLALRDLRAMDVDPQRAIAALRPHPTERLVEWFRASVHAADPIGCVGYAYAVERLALEVGAAELAAVQAILPDGVRATRCMRVHSSVGSDADHVDETVAVVTRLAPDRRQAVARAVFDSACLSATPPPDGHPDDAALARRLIGAFELQP
ncbi:MAG TPA: hypothetical protein VK034_04680 [Enhygromyxa sp.]|nr:hypothetical protein [Enhygromyxa sp.]